MTRWTSTTSSQRSNHTEENSLSSMEMLADYPDLLRIEHLQELTGLSAQTLRKEINEGRLPGCRIGRRLYVPKPHLLRYIESERSAENGLIRRKQSSARSCNRP